MLLVKILTDHKYFQVMKKEVKENTWNHKTKIIITAIYEPFNIE